VSENSWVREVFVVLNKFFTGDSFLVPAMILVINKPLSEKAEKQVLTLGGTLCVTTMQLE
jgi:hypothetical protein